MRPDEGPWFILIAGVNGAGKSTFASPDTLGAILGESTATEINVINPDDETRRILATDPSLDLSQANHLAAERCMTDVLRRIEAREGNFAIETVLSTDKYQSVVGRALELGWRFLFVYIVLESVEESIARVAERVARGGHDVPIDKIRARWPRSRANMPWFWMKATSAFMYWNWSTLKEPPVRLAFRHRGEVARFFPAQAPKTLREIVPPIELDMPNWPAARD